MKSHSHFSIRVIILYIFIVVLLLLQLDALSAQPFNYRNLADVNAELANLASANPAIATLVTLSPSTEEGRSVTGIKISDNVAASENEQRLLFLGEHHAREWISVEVPLLLARYLIENYTVDSRITSIIRNTEIWILPVANPDGYDYAWNTNRGWRKNRRDNGAVYHAYSDQGKGVDMNRNYPASAWGTIDDSHNSHVPTADSYNGPSAGSEREVQAITALIQQQQFQFVLSYHSYSQLILYPWGFTQTPVASTEDNVLFRALSGRMSDLMAAVPGGERYVFQQASDLYITAGDLVDYVYEVYNIPAFTIELRPLMGDPAGFELPAAQISPTWEENRAAALFMLDYFNLKITVPTAFRPVLAGNAGSPNRIDITIDGVWRNKSASDFTVRIGGLTAGVVGVSRLPEVNSEEINNGYTLLVQPPAQPADGSYDLEVIMGGASHLVPGGVIYGQEANVDVVLLIDKSDSMNGQNIADAKVAAGQFVDFMFDNDAIGVSSFSVTAARDFNLTTIAGNVKDAAKEAIDNIVTVTRTSIGAGLQEAWDQIKTSGNINHPRSIVLLSDGGENEPPFALDVLPGIVADGIKVHTIGMTDVLNLELLQQIAIQSGGEHRFTPSSNGLSSIYGEMSAEAGGLQIVSASVQQVALNSIDSRQVTVDSTATTVDFSILWAGSDLDLTLVSPGGRVIDPAVAAADPLIDFVISGNNMEYYRVTAPETGVWTMQTFGKDVNPSGVEDYNLRVVARTGLSLALNLGSSYLTGDRVVVNVTLADTQPIREGSVTLLVEAPDAGKTSITLFDDGGHEDGAAADGTYGNAITATEQAGSYLLTIFAAGSNTAGHAFTRQQNRSVFIKQRPPVTVDVIAPAGSEVTAGGSVTYNFTVKNNAAEDSTFNLFYAEGDVSQWADLAGAPRSLTIAAGASATLPVTIIAPSSGEQNFASLLSVRATSTTEPLNTDSASVLTQIKAADLAVTITGPATVQPCTMATYTLTYRNNGPAPATNSFVAIELPGSVNYVKDSLGGAQYQQENVVGWYLAALPGNSQGSINVSLTFTGASSPETNVILTAAILNGLNRLGNAPGQPDNNPANNFAKIEVSRLAALQASAALSLADRVAVYAPFTIGGRQFELGSQAVAHGSVMVDGNGFLRNNALVMGDLVLAGTVETQAGAEVLGTTRENATLSLPGIPVKTISYGSRDMTVNNDRTATWSPGNYQDGMIRARGKVTFTAGIYNFRDLTFEPDTTLILDTTRGEVVVNVQNNLAFGDRFSIVNSNPALLSFYTNTTGILRIGTENKSFNGSIIAPYGNIQIFSRTVIRGSIAGNTIRVEPDVTLETGCDGH